MNNENEYRDNHILCAMGGLLIGSLAGALTMLLLAPQSGEKTRMQIQDKSIELRNQANEVYEDVMKQVKADGKKFSKDGRKKAKELFHNGQELVIEQLEHVSQAAKAGKKAIQNV